MGVHLRRSLPKSGMTYQSKHRLLHRSRRDALVANALNDAGYQMSTQGVSQAFIPMFQIATPIFIDARAEGKSLWDMLPEVKRELDWAQLVRFRKAVGDCPQEDNRERPDYVSWILVDAEIYNVLASGLDEDEDEDESEDQEMGECDEREDLVPPMQKMTMETSEGPSDAMDIDN
ncbi:hypothetical protein O1611_g782 [Lasiodiplodia mahajangana]|uniref:Uncharacterized protein n=1 Tax=Lasiodiplodia mahajangana TaxID=1108764 RepID=A0ACC2JZD0_9PEZI|nr:hypothetical protein O1611_g782 [Lasiodiplodia mahajangana]